MFSDQPRRPSGLLLVSLAILGLAIVEVVGVLALYRPGSGANIGLPIALFAALAAGVGVGLVALARGLPARSRFGFAAHAGAVLALLVASGFILMVGIGILEELR